MKAHAAGWDCRWGVPVSGDYGVERDGTLVAAERTRWRRSWTFRFLSAALAESLEEEPADDVAAGLPHGRAAEPAEPTTAQVRAWARQQWYDVPRRGRLRPEVWAAYRAAKP
jgi:hypothetical protein